ncbi:MAG: ATPase [Flavobacteriaceae bacterium]
MGLPFKFGKVVEKRFFVNRKFEIDFLKQNILSQINVTLISPRRWGKSSLVHIATSELSKTNKQIKICHIDLFNIRTEEEFYKTFASSVIKASTTKWEEQIKLSKLFFKKLIPKLSFGVDESNSLSLSFDWEEVKKDPSEILNLPELISKKKKIQLVICLDEFQNISHFKYPLAFQKKLRANWQHHQKASYVIYGSKQHMMTQIFESKSMPFYKFGEVIFLLKISNDHWKKYIVRKFKATKKTISSKLASKLAHLVENHSYFVQQFANMVWLNTEDVCNEEIIEKSLDQLLNQYEILFIKELDYLSNTQVNFLKALCKDEPQLSGKKTIAKYKLGTSGNVTKIKKALIDKEIIDKQGKNISFQDPLFKLWLKKRYITNN